MPRVRESGGGSARDRRRKRRAKQFVPKKVQAARLRIKMLSQAAQIRIKMASQRKKITAANKVIDWCQITSTERVAMGEAMLSVERHRRQAKRPTKTQIDNAKRAKAKAAEKLFELQQQMAALNP